MKKLFAPKFNPRRTAVIISLTAVIVILTQRRDASKFHQSYKDGDVDCHFEDEENLPLANYYNFSSQKQIFFHETSCKGGLDSRQACAVESAARVNSEWDINVFFVGPPSKMFLNSTSYETLRQTSNVHFYRVIIATFNDNTPMRRLSPTDFMYTNKKYSLRNLSNMLRFLTLYKYGGVYLDLDVISARSLNAFPLNWIAKQSSGVLGAGALGLAKDNVGRSITEKIIRDFNKSYNQLMWSRLNTGVLTRAMRDLCATKSVNKMSNQTCLGMAVLDRTYFYPIHYVHVDQYFSPGEASLTHAYGHHTWNNRSRSIAVPRGSLLANLARQFCPVTYRLYGDKFGF